MSFAFDKSHFEISALKNIALENMRLMSATRDTSHFPIGPCGPLEQSPLGDSLRHALTARLSSALDSGENAGRKGGYEVNIKAEFPRIGRGDEYVQ